MPHPLDRIPPGKRLSVFIVFLILTLLSMTVMQVVGIPLKNDTATAGIISLELAYTPAKAQALIASWDTHAISRANFIQGLDFSFLVIYSTTITLVCLWAGRVIRAASWPLAGLGLPLAWGQWLAAALDLLENIALVVVLFAGVNSPWTQLAAICAVPKFALIVLGLGYGILGAGAWIARPAARKA